MPFDINGAKQAGYSDAEIADYLATDKSAAFDVNGARKAGYSDSEIVSHVDRTQRGLEGDFGASQNQGMSGALSAAGDYLKGVGASAADIVGGGIGMTGAAIPAAIETLTQGPEAGKKMFGQISTAMNPFSQQGAILGPALGLQTNLSLPGSATLDVGRQTPTYEAAMKPFEMIPQGYGNIAAAITSGVGGSNAAAEKAGAYGDVGSMIAMAALGGKEAVDKVRATAADQARVAHEAEVARTANDVVAKAQADDQAIQEYQAAYNELDNTMVKYPDEYQAPQYGLGGKSARIPDQVGRPKVGITQEAYDADLQAAQKTSAAWEQDMENKYRNVDFQPADIPPPSMQEAFMRQANEQGQLGNIDVTSPGAGGTSYEGGIDYPIQKPRLYGPEATASALDRPPQADLTMKMNAETPSASDALEAAQAESTIRNNLWSKLDQQAVANGEVNTVPQGTLKYNDFVDQLNKNSTDKWHKIVGNLVNKIAKDTNIRVVNDEDFARIHGGSLAEAFKSQGFYDGATNQIYIRARDLNKPYILLHEGVHAAVGLFQKLRPDHPYSQAIRFLYDRVKNELQATGRADDAARYGFTNELEFIAEAFSNPDFQHILKTTALSKEDIATLNQFKVNAKLSFGKSAKFVWHYMLEAFRRILGGDPKMGNALSHALDLGGHLIEDIHGEEGLHAGLAEEAGLNFAPLEKMNVQGKPSMEFSDFKKQMEDRGIKMADAAMRAVYEQAMTKTKAPKPNTGTPLTATIEAMPKKAVRPDLAEEMLGNRPREDVVKDTLAQKDMALPDAKIYGNVAPPTFAAKLNPYTRWVAAQVRKIKNNYDVAAEEVLTGNSRKEPRAGSYNFQWKKLNDQSRIAVNEVGQALNNADVWKGEAGIQAKARELLGRQLNPDELQAYKDRVRINQAVLKKINNRLVQENRPPIHELPHYWSPAEFQGPFLTFFKKVLPDGTVEHEATKVQSSYVRPNIDKLQAAVGDGFKVSFVEKGLRSDFDYTQFEQALRYLNKEQRDPAARAITEALRRRGLMRTGLKRSGAAGALGTEGGLKGMRKYEEVSERYIRQVHEYLGNRELDDLYKQTMDDERLKARPNATEFALEQLDTARGGGWAWADTAGKALATGLNLAVRTATFDKLQLPEKFINDVFKAGNKAATVALLGFGNLTYLMANLMQGEMFAPIKMLAMASENAGKNLVMSPLHVFNAWARAHVKLLDPNHPDIQALDKIGALDATFRYDYSSYRTSSVRSKVGIGLDVLSGRSLMSWIERNAVRRPASLMFLEMIRELGMDKDLSPHDTYFLAKRLTDKYMVSMKWYEKAQMFSRSGVIGTATGALQSFTTTWTGMLAEYSRLATEGSLKNPANALPLGAFLGVTFLTAGIVGLPLVQELDGVVALANKLFHTDYPSATELLFRTTKSRTLRYGVLSSQTGWNIGASMASPQATGVGPGPGIQYLTNLGNLALTGIRATGALGTLNKPTQTDWRDALAGVAPRFTPFPDEQGNIGAGSKAWVERQFTPPGVPYETKRDVAGPVTRDEADWQARRFGTHSLKETEKQMNMHIANTHQIQRSDMLREGMSQIADKIYSGQNPQQTIQAVLPMLAKEGYTGDEIKASLLNAVKSKLIEQDIRDMGKVKTSGQRNLVMILQQLGTSR